MTTSSRRTFLKTSAVASAAAVASTATLAQSSTPSVATIESVGAYEAKLAKESTVRWNDGLAHPIPYMPAPGIGKARGIAFGGGGVILISWYTGYFHALRKKGLDLSNADVIVGTSAGSIFGSMLASGNLWRLTDVMDFFKDFPKIFAALVPEVKKNPSQLRAEAFALRARDAKPQTIQAIGRAAMASRNQASESKYYETLKRLIGLTTWTSDALHITSNDCYTGDRLVVSKSSGIDVDVACGASSSLPGGAGPTFLKDRLCMDGGICQTSTHSDVIAGVKKALVFSLGDGTRNEVTQGLRTSGMLDTLLEEIRILKANGTDTIHVSAGLPPGISRVDNIMNPKLIGPYLKYGFERGNADFDRLKAFWA